MEKADMQALNNQTRGIDKVTDVLSYPTMDGIRGEVLLKANHPTDVDGDRLMLGSIVLCNQKIKEQALEFGHSEERERTYLIVHGLMHLFGYDHMTDEDKKQMREKEKAALSELGINE
jgi:probable rRNA maturation factor